MQINTSTSIQQVNVIRMWTFKALKTKRYEKIKHIIADSKKEWTSSESGITINVKPHFVGPLPQGVFWGNPSGSVLSCYVIYNE